MYLQVVFLSLGRKQTCSSSQSVINKSVINKGVNYSAINKSLPPFSYFIQTLHILTDPSPLPSTQKSLLQVPLYPLIHSSSTFDYFGLSIIHYLALAYSYSIFFLPEGNTHV